MRGQASRARVLLVVRWPIGGIRTYLKYTLPYLKADSFELDILLVTANNSESLQSDLGGTVKNWFCLPEEEYSVVKLSAMILRSDKVREYDIVHAHGFTSLISTLLPSVFIRAKLIFTSHDVLNKRQFLGINGRLRRILLGFSLRACETIQSVSVDAERNLLELYPNMKKKSNVILNGIKTEQFTAAPVANIKNEINLDQEVILIGFFGRFMSQKGFKYLLESIEILKAESADKKFHVACFGGGAFYREEGDEIKKRGLMDSFSFMPFRPDVSSAMKGCDLIVMPSLWEACPLQPMEALCSGVPFVGSDCIGLREVIASTPAVQFPAGDSQALASAILNCISKGRQPFLSYVEKAKKRYTVEKTASELSLMYEKVLYREHY